MSRNRLLTLAAIATLLVAAIVIWRNNQSPAVTTLSGPAQGTSYHVSFWTEADVDTNSLQRLIDEEFVRLDRLLSNYRKDSTIERWNSNNDTEPVAVGEEIVRLVQQARRVSELTGCYDLTVEPLFQLWGFRGDSLTPPKDKDLKAALARVGFHHIALSDDARLQKLRPDVHVDLSSIAQGYSIGRIASLLEAQGIYNYLVELGGEMQTRGRKPDGEFWRVGIEQPRPGAQTPASLLKVLAIRRTEPLSIMTSGTYRHYFDRHGQRCSHILDARTGRPVTHGTVSVTVLHADPSAADAWSTALLCLGTRAGLEVANQESLAALFVDEADDVFRESASRAWIELQDVEIE